MPPLKVGIAALFLGVSGVSFAGLIAIVPPADATVYGQAAGYGNTRGIYINADTNFSISSLGEFGYPIGANTVLVASIYASNGTTRGALLASNSASFASDGTTMTWNDIPLSYSFTAGLNYVLDIGFTASYPTNDLETFYWYYPSGSTTTFDVAGLFTVSHGDDTIGGTPQTNPLIADFRVGTNAILATPEPATASLLVAGMLGLVARKKLLRAKR
jgi:hypothetical protein